MNNKRRNRIYQLIAEIEAVRTAIEEIKDEEQESFDNLPESIQYSERGERMEEIIQIFDDCDSSFEEITDHLNDASQ